MKIFIVLMFLGLSLAFAGPSEPVTIESIESYISTHKIESIEDFLKNLDKKTRSNFVLMHTSFSLQEASYQKPRVLMHSDSGEFVFSFNSDSSQKNGNKIEVMLFNRLEARFSMHEIDFSGGAPVIHKNPQSCVACHGSDPRPNWSGYSSWPGAYGSNDDRLVGHTRKAGISELDETQYIEMGRFNRIHKRHPRYRYLSKLKDHYDPEDRSYGRDKKYPTLRYFSRTKNNANANFTDKVIRLNFLRMLRIFKAQPQYENFKYAVAAVLTCKYDDFKKFIPENFSLPEPDIAPFFRTGDLFLADSIRERFYLALMKRLNIDTEFLDTSFNLDGVTNKDGIPLNDPPRLRTPGNQPIEFGRVFAAGDPDFRNFYDGSCGSFAEKGAELLSLIPDSSNEIKTLPNHETGKELFSNNCLSCHGEVGILDYTFSEKDLGSRFSEDPALIQKFRYRLSKDTPVDSRMPLGRHLSDENRIFIQEYIETFSQKAR